MEQLIAGAGWAPVSEFWFQPTQFCAAVAVFLRLASRRGRRGCGGRQGDFYRQGSLPPALPWLGPRHRVEMRPAGGMKLK